MALNMFASEFAAWYDNGLMKELYAKII